MSFRKIALALSVLALLVISVAAQEYVYNVSKQTGMTPGVASIDSGVRTAPAGSLANIAGDWTLTLDNAETKSLKLTLYQNNDAVFGSGDITVSGNANPVSAGGTLKATV